MKVVKIDKDLEPLYQDYLNFREDDLVELKEALEAKSFERIENVAHKIAGNAGAYGMIELGELAQAVERAAVEKNMDSILVEVKKVYQHINEADIVFE